MGEKEFGSKKKLGPKEILALKIFWVQKKFWAKNKFWAQKIWVREKVLEPIFCIGYTCVWISHAHTDYPQSRRFVRMAKPGAQKSSQD